MSRNSESSTSSSLVSEILTKDSTRRVSKNRRIEKNTGICTKPECTKAISEHLPPIRLPNLKNEEIWGVKALPSDFKSVSKPSQIMENLYKKRQARHEAVLERVETQFGEIDFDIETQIRVNAEIIKQKLQDSESLIHKCFQELDVNEEKMLTLTKNNFGDVSETISKTYEKYNKNIEVFYTFLQETEKERSKKYKKVLKIAYQELQEISYILPYDLQKYFENKILRINQMLLNNFRCYAELHLQLNIQAENVQRIRTQNFDDLNTKWKRIKRKDALMKLNEKKLVQMNCEEVLLQTEQGKTATRLFSDKEHNMEEMWASVSPLPIRMKDVKTWTKEMENTVNELDFFARKLITLYKMAIVQVFNGYFDELQTLTEGMFEMGYSDVEDMSKMSLELCKPTIENVTRQYSTELQNLENLWESVVTHLNGKLQTTYLFLNSVAHLWDCHFQRLEEAKTIVLKDLKNSIQKNDKAHQDQEIKLNVALDILRQAPTEAKLESAFDDANRILDNLKNTYNLHYVAESKVVEKYTALVTEEVEVLLVELQQFLNKHPKTSVIFKQPKEHVTKILTDATESDNNGGFGNVIPRQMKMCEYQVDAVHNWMFGLREAIERYTDTCKEEILQQAEEWTCRQNKKLAKRLEVKLAIHTPQYARVQFDIYDIRLAELKKHFERIERHKAGAEQEIENIKKQYIEQETRFQDIVNEYDNKIAKIKNKIAKAKTANVVKSYVSDLKYNTKLCNQKLSNLMRGQENLFNAKLNEITNASTKFSKEMKLFLEDGNFNYDESKKITKDLKSFEKKLKKKFSVVMKEIAGKQKKVFNQVQQNQSASLNNFNYSLQEFEFNERAVTTIKDLQVDMKTQAYNMKFLNKKLEQQFQTIEETNSINLGNISNFNQFENDFSQIVLDLLQAISSLYQPEPVINLNKQGYKSAVGADFQSKSSKQTIPSTKDSTSGSLLFDRIPTENNSFMSKIYCKLHNSIQVLEKEAKEFYAMHEKGIVNKDKVQPTYEEFMKEVLKKFYSYYLQCEVLWLNLTNEYMEALQKFFNFFVNYQRHFFAQFHNNQLGELKEKHVELITTVTNIKTSNMKALIQTHSKLKPLHGYNKNKHLLENIQNEIQEILENIRGFNLHELFDPYRECQVNHVALYESNFVEIRNKLVALYHASFDQLFYVPLMRQFEDKLLYVKGLANDKTINENDTDINDLYSSIEIPYQFEDNLIKTRMLLDTHFLNPDGISYEDNLKLDNYLQTIRDEHEQYMIQVNKIKTTWYDDSDNFERIFNAEVQKVLKLYSIKYDNLPPID